MQRSHSEKQTGSKQKNGNKPKKSSDEENSLMTFKVHECRFLQLSLVGVTAVATSPSGRYIVLARSDCTVELKDREAMWSTTSAIPADYKERDTVYTSMAFSNCGSYVFAARAHGTIEVLKITEDGLVHHVSLTPGGGEITGVAVCRDMSNVGFKLALACADGRVRIMRPDPSFFSAEDGQELPTNTAFYETLSSEKTMAPVSCVAWYINPASEEETCIAAGDRHGGIRWINPSTGSCYGTAKIPSLDQVKVVMNTIQFSQDGKQVLCGDSRGLITIWSSASNTISDEFRIDGSHGEVLSSAVHLGTEFAPRNEMGKSEVVFGTSSGEVAALRSIPGAELWSISRVRRIHTHKVCSIAVLPNGLFVSCSIDSFLAVFPSQALSGNGTFNWLWPHFRCVGQPDVQLLPDKGIALSKTSSVIEIWSFSRSTSVPVLSLRMNLERLSGLRSCSFDTQRGFMAVSTIDSFKIFRADGFKSNTVDFESVGGMEPFEISSEASSTLRGAIDMVYCGRNLVCLSKCRRRIFLFDGSRVHLLTLPPFDQKIGMFFCKLSGHSKKIMVSDSHGNVVVCTFDDSSEGMPSYRCRILRCPLQSGQATHVSAISFSLSGTRAAVAYTDLSLCVLNLSKKHDQAELFSDKEYFVIDSCFSSIANALSFARTEDSVLADRSNNRQSQSKEIVGIKTYNSNEEKVRYLTRSTELRKSATVSRN
ncbi:unnamed protein product [Agarophyton chilense]